MNQKDIKLLWGRAANRCSLCQLELSQDKQAITAAFTLGEQAHIVGEKEDAPRGKSPLNDDERNSYHNIILLCPNHHTEIDKNESDWPTEKLHIAKSKHELWVRETLGDASDTRLLANQLAVTTIIDAAVKLCLLEDWTAWTSHALSPDPIWQGDLPNKIFEFRQKVAATIWPAEYEELKRATTTFAILIHNAARKFLEHSDCENDKYRPHKFYKAGGFNPNYDRDLKEYEDWLDECWRLVKDATRAANWFAEIVRRDVNPMFFIELGKFRIIEGPFFDFSYRASVPEFPDERKLDLPNELLINAQKFEQN